MWCVGPREVVHSKWAWSGAVGACLCQCTKALGTGLTGASYQLTSLPLGTAEVQRFSGLAFFGWPETHGIESLLAPHDPMPHLTTATPCVRLDTELECTAHTTCSYVLLYCCTAPGGADPGEGAAAVQDAGDGGCQHPHHAPTP